ncbi:MAG: DUF5689 domain-containing protein [Kaistella sp.]
MNFKKYFKSALVVAISALTFSSCVHNDDWETPPINCTNKFAAPTMTLAEFKAQAPTNGYVLIETDQIFDGYVVSSDENGNFYKTISFQDKPENPTAGLQMEVDRASNYADFPVGTHIRINAKGLRLGTDRGVVKIGSVDPTFSIGRIPASMFSRYIAGVCNGNALDIAKLVPKQLASLGDAMNPANINLLVSVPNVQFSTSLLYPVNKTYIDYVAGAGVDTDRAIEDATGDTTVLRNSGFASFGSTLLPKGSGKLTFVVSRYNNSWQMLIRNLNDVEFTNPVRFDTTPPKGGTNIAYLGSFLENFESYTYSSSPYLEVFPKYVNDALLGNRYWQLRSFSNNKYIQLGANSGSGQYETFFVVPVDFTAANSLTFKVNVGFYNGDALSVYTTKDYVPLGDITSATLTNITSSFTIPKTPTSGYGVLTNAGTHQFPAGLTGNGFVVFKYTGNGSGVTTTIQLDDIQVQ